MSRARKLGVKSDLFLTISSPLGSWYCRSGAAEVEMHCLVSCLLSYSRGRADLVVGEAGHYVFTETTESTECSELSEPG